MARGPGEGHRFWPGTLTASETSPRQKAVSAPGPSATAVQNAVAVPKVTVSTGVGGLQESEMRPAGRAALTLSTERSKFRLL